MIFEALRRNGRSEDLRKYLASFASGVGVYDLISAGAGPRADGSVDEEVVAKNVQSLGEEEAAANLSQWLYEYVAFALFVACPELPKAEEKALSKQVSERLALLAPKG